MSAHGCSLACFYFEAFSSFLEWVIKKETNSDLIIHYFDYFLFLGSRDSGECLYLLNTFFNISKYFNIPLAVEKTVGRI